MNVFNKKLGWLLLAEGLILITDRPSSAATDACRSGHHFFRNIHLNFSILRQTACERIT